MNPQHDQQTPSRLHQTIQLLVDNELSAEQTTAVLLQCEQDSTAWRTLALRMLEARELKGGLSDLLKVSDSACTAKAIEQPLSLKSRWLWRGLVACIAVATFIAGRSIPRAQNKTSEIATAESTEVESVDPLVAFAENSNVSAISDVTVPSVAIVNDVGVSVVGYAQILHSVGSEPPVPVIAGPDLDYSALLTQQRRIPESIARQYRNQGMVVENQRRVISLQLTDGQKFAIPLDQLDVRYVGNELL